MTVTAALESYIVADLPEADAALEIMERLEGTQSPEWRARRLEQRKKSAQRKLQWRFDCGRDAGPAPEWVYDAVLASARERRDVIAAAVACCEQRQGGDRLTATLGEYLKGDRPISCVRDLMESLGLGIEGAKVIPFVPHRRT